MTVNPMCEHVETAQGVPLTVTGVAQIKIMRAEDLLRTAAEQFLGVPVHNLKQTVNQTLEGHLRAILGKESGFSFFSQNSYTDSPCCIFSTYYLSEIMIASMLKQFLCGKSPVLLD